ncbi:MAG: hypothetical protein WAN66_13935 [Limnoraphis robusta]|uniref:hypothetical protein n=1 Tax=Limnoraphis robusta TaxID=1118279 RepID=UPI0013649B27|nr:hypothetical protein [Limnoraphis robusta]
MSAFFRFRTNNISVRLGRVLVLDCRVMPAELAFQCLIPRKGIETFDSAECRRY